MVRTGNGTGNGDTVEPGHTSDGEEIVLKRGEIACATPRSRANTNGVATPVASPTTPPRRVSKGSSRTRLGSRDSEEEGSPRRFGDTSNQTPTGGSKRHSLTASKSPNSTTPSRRELMPKVDGAERTRAVTNYFLRETCRWKSKPRGPLPTGESHKPRQAGGRNSRKPRIASALRAHTLSPLTATSSSIVPDFALRADAWYRSHPECEEDPALREAWPAVRTWDRVRVGSGV